jgi:acetyl esterase
MALDPALKLVLDQLDSGDAPKLQDSSPEQARALYADMQMPAPDLELASVEDGRIPGTAGEIPVRIYRPVSDPVDTLLPALVYLHGGGWVIGSVETHDSSCRELAHGTGCIVVSVDYRLAPEARFPAAADDCFEATQWVASNAADLGIDPERVAIGGDSAGGNLAAVVSLMARDRGGPELRFQLLIYPVTDADFETGSYVENAEGYLLERDAMRWFWDHYVPDAAARTQPYAAPLRASDLSGLPPALVITAEFDPLRDEGEAYANRLKSAGVATTLTRYDGMIHGFFPMTPLVEGARAAVAESCAALRSAFGSGERS